MLLGNIFALSTRNESIRATRRCEKELLSQWSLDESLQSFRICKAFICTVPKPVHTIARECSRIFMYENIYDYKNIVELFNILNLFNGLIVVIFCEPSLKSYCR